MLNLDNYDYILPKKNLALSPTIPRDSSRIFVYDTKKDQINFDFFYNLDKYLPLDSFLVLNNTKVLPARVIMRKETGGKVVMLFLVNEISDRRYEIGANTIKALVDRKVNVGEKIFFDEKNFLTIISQDKHIFTLEYSFSKERLLELLKKYGTMSIPLYLKKTPLKRDKLLEKYQTVFAKSPPVGWALGSVAAPTASLHFTKRVFKKLEKKRIEKYFITLHVGLGTFAPITDKNLKEKKLHEEYYEIDESTWKQIEINRKGPPSPRLRWVKKKLVAVGTTVVRTLESIIKYRHSGKRPSEDEEVCPESELDSGFARSSVSWRIRSLSRMTKSTDLFIFPPYNFKMVDALITNFHLPKSSLMMLVEAFLQYKRSKRHLVNLYKIAIENDFRFYSFGDAMVIL